MNYTENTSIGLKIQKMGRAQRIDDDKLKNNGYYIYPISKNHNKLFEALADFIKAFMLLDNQESSTKLQSNRTTNDNIHNILKRFNIKINHITCKEIYERVKEIINKGLSLRKQWDILTEDVRNKKIYKQKDYQKG